jgi:hypothetical protein
MKLFPLLCAWAAIVAHAGVLVATRYRRSDVRLVPSLNLVMAMCVLLYWMPRWYSYVKGVAWYATDQLLPLYALLVCVVSGLALSGHYRGTTPHWILFGLHALVCVAAAVFLGTFRITRLI